MTEQKRSSVLTQMEVSDEIVHTRQKQEHFERAPVGVYIAIPVIALLVGTFAWYLPKRSECESQITYIPEHPATFNGEGKIGAKYTFDKNDYAEHKNAMSACLWM